MPRTVFSGAGLPNRAKGQIFHHARAWKFILAWLGCKGGGRKKAFRSRKFFLIWAPETRQHRPSQHKPRAASGARSPSVRLASKLSPSALLIAWELTSPLKSCGLVDQAMSSESDPITPGPGEVETVTLQVYFLGPICAWLGPTPCFHIFFVYLFMYLFIYLFMFMLLVFISIINVWYIDTR